MSPQIPWWRRDRQRVEREQDAMLRHPEMQWCRDPAQPELYFWRGAVVVGERRFDVQVTYPAWYPDVPPEVRAFDADEAPVDFSDTLHVFPDGRPCLYTHDDGSEGWHPNYTAADALDRFAGFVGLAERGEHLPVYASGPPALPGRTLGHLGSMAIVPRSLADALGRIQTGKPAMGDMALWVTWDDRVRATLRVHEVTLPGGVKRAVSATERILLPGGLDASGLWVRWPGRPEQLWRIGAGFGALVDLIARRGRERARVEAAPCILLSWSEAGGERLAMFVNPGLLGPRLAAWLPGSDLLRVETHVLDGIDQLGVRNAAVVGADAASAWETIHIVMVGLGSLGSTVAVELAKAGARHFTLFDPDLLRPENLSRHVGGVESLFRPKVEAVIDRIHAHNPLAKAVGRALAAPECGGQRHLFREALARPDTLVIVTTAERHSEALINRMALEAGVPVIFGSVLGPAAHGRVLRVIPGVSPCLQCVALAQSRDPERCPRFEGAPGEASTLPADRYRQPSLPGVSIDVGRVALLVARMALGTLARTHRAIEYPDPGYHHVICTQHGGWVFGADDHAIRPVSLSAAPDCPACGR